MVVVVESSMGSCRCDCIIEGVMLWDRKDRIWCIIADSIVFERLFGWTVTEVLET